ncbi:MAG: PRC-barrel domain-containing protein [Pseudomonadota bacterium]
MEHDDRFDKFEDLGNYKLTNPEQDIRGRTLVDLTGKILGKIDEMIVDLEEEEVAAVRLEDGRVCGVDRLEIKDDHVVYQGTPVTHYVRIRFAR